jgi:hypothetical protein
MAAALAARRRGRAGLERPWRGGVPAERGAAGPAAGRAGGRPSGLGRDEDQRWTLERAATLIGRLFHVRYTLRGTSCLLHRLGFTPQVPVHRAAERDEDAIAAWRAVTWAPHGRTPVVRVSGKGSGRVSVAGMVCLKPGARGHLYYRVRIHRGRKGERRSMSEADYAGLAVRAGLSQ